MKKVAVPIIILVAIGIGAFLVISWAKQPKPKVKPEEAIPELQVSSVEKEKVGVTLISVYDNYQVDPELKLNWGFGCLVKLEKGNILFDTGGSSSILLFNLKKMKVDPRQVDKIIISHIHGDHVGGLKGFLKENGNVTVYIPASFPDSIRKEIESYGAEYKDIKEPEKISEGIFSTGELGTWIKEQSLIVSTEKGLIVITGCAHPGVVNIVKKAKEMFPEEKVYLVLGGFHHPPMAVVKQFRELGVKKVAPSHCTGDPVREAFREEYKEDFIEYGVGKIIEIKEAKLEEVKAKKQVIKTEAKGEIIKYQEDSLYSEDDFAVILENEDEFKSQLIEKFKKEIIRVTAENCKVDLDQSKKSALLKCNIKGARYGTNSYNMHFLLGNWPFDLMNFERFERKLTWEGEIDDVPTSIVFEFPYTLSHCHEHVWPK